MPKSVSSPTMGDLDRTIVNNVSTGENLKDVLQKAKTLSTIGCQKNKCAGAFMGTNVTVRKCINKTNQSLQAREFLQEYFQQTGKQVEFEARWAQASVEIETKGSYELTEDELTFGARTAWRNSARCSGRSQWQSLMLRDCRNVTTIDQMFVQICQHIKESSNNGIIIPMISVFPPRKNGRDPIRIWNPQMISYAGYATDDPKVFIGDRANASFTQFCQSLGWKGKGTRFDILPLVLSGSDGEPKWFVLPEDILLIVKIKHPTLPQLDQLNLQWYGLPAVSGMLLEVGGLQFPACPFSGWYCLTEVATRDLLDEHRYNLLHEVANTLGFDTSIGSNLWKDRVCTELSVAVLHSFNTSGVAMVDHHTLSDQFMGHYRDEHKKRGGCPADWVWIVPPMSGSLCLTFHQEMLNYHLSPSYEYQECLWKRYKSNPDKKMSVGGLGRALWFMSSLYVKRYQLRNPAYIFYGTMTGTSKMFSSSLAKCLDQLYNVTTLALNEQSMEFMLNMTKDDVVFIITSTTGNGEPPHHAIAFKSAMQDLLKTGQKPLNHLKFAVFALGSSIYDNFCTFGKLCDSALVELGAQRVAPLALGDEQKGQDRAFRNWAKLAFQGSCEALDMDIPFLVQQKWPFSRSLIRKASWAPHSFRTTNSISDMKKFHGTALQAVSLLNTVLVSKKKQSDRYCLFTIGFPSNPSIRIRPGDHINIFPENDPTMVATIMKILADVPPSNEIVAWEECDVPPCTLKKALTCYLDLGSTPMPDMMSDWVQYTNVDTEREAITLLCEDQEVFTEWRNKRPNILDFLKIFPGLKIPAGSFVASMSKLIPRAYSIASIEPRYALVGGQNIPVTDILLEVVQFSSGPFKENEEICNKTGVCSNYLMKLPVGGRFLSYHHSNQQFKMPMDPNVPIVMISAGSGIAPFRAFWQQRSLLHWDKNSAWLYFGCRDENENLFEEETAKSVQRIVAFSRKSNSKIYVQDLVVNDGELIYDLIMNRKAHFYICGKVAMALDVKQKLLSILSQTEDANEIMNQLKRSGRLMEEYFG